MGSVAMFWVTRASIHAELILVDDHDGREMTLNTILRASALPDTNFKVGDEALLFCESSAADPC